MFSPLFGCFSCCSYYLVNLYNYLLQIAVCNFVYYILTVICGFIILFYFDKFNVKFKCCIWWNNSWMSSVTVRIIRWAYQHSTLSNRHLWYTLVPAANYLTLTDSESERFATISWWIEYLTIVQCASVMDNSCLSRLWECASY